MKISLFCNAGMSTSLVAKKVQDYYHAKGVDNDVEAFDFSLLIDEADDSDLVILAPQVSWAEDDVHRDYPDKPVLTLTMQEFGSMNGEIVGKRIDQFLAEKGGEKG